MLDELVALLKLAADFDNLLDVMVCSELHGANVDLDGIAQEILKDAVSGWGLD